MTVQLLKCTNKSRRLCKRVKESGMQSHHMHAKNYRKTLDRLKLSAQREFYNEVFAKIGKNAKMMWEVLNRVMKRTNNKTEIRSVVTSNGTVYDPKSVANVFNDHFHKAGKKTQVSIKLVNANVNPLDKVKRVEANLEIGQLSESKLCKLVSNLEAKRSTGYDDISNFLLKK